MKKLLIIVVVAVLGLPTLVVATRTKGRQENQQSATRQPSFSLLSKTGTLHDAAVAAGGGYFQGIDGGPDQPIGNVRALTTLSDAVLVGETIENRCHLTANGKMAATTYRVKVLQVVAAKSALGRPKLEGSEIMVTVLGGRVEFPDGTFAQTLTKHFRRPVNGERYLFFLTEVPTLAESIAPWAGETPVYSVLFGSNGLFGIPRTGAYIEPRGRAGERIARSQMRPKTVAALLTEVQGASSLVGTRRRDR